MPDCPHLTQYSPILCTRSRWQTNLSDARRPRCCLHQHEPEGMPSQSSITIMRARCQILILSGSSRVCMKQVSVCACTDSVCMCVCVCVCCLHQHEPEGMQSQSSITTMRARCQMCVFIHLLSGLSRVCMKHVSVCACTSMHVCVYTAYRLTHVSFSNFLLVCTLPRFYTFVKNK